MKTLQNIFILAATAFALSSCSFINNIKDALDGDDEEGSDNLQYNLEQAQNNLDRIVNSTGIEISAKFYTKENGSETIDNVITYGAKDGTSWNYDGDSGYAYVKNDNDVYFYSYDEEAGWYYVSSIELEEFESEYGDSLELTTWLFSANAYDGSFKKNGTTRVAGRTCDIYEYNFNAFVEKMNYSFAIDQETGMTLKSDVSAGFMGESASTGFEVTSFKTSGITLPELPSPELGE